MRSQIAMTYLSENDYLLVEQYARNNNVAISDLVKSAIRLMCGDYEIKVANLNTDWLNEKINTCGRTLNVATKDANKTARLYLHMIHNSGHDIGVLLSSGKRLLDFTNQALAELEDSRQEIYEYVYGRFYIFNSSKDTMAQTKVRLAARIDQELYSRFEAIANVKQISKSKLIKDGLLIICKYPIRKIAQEVTIKPVALVSKLELEKVVTIRTRIATNYMQLERALLDVQKEYCVNGLIDYYAARDFNSYVSKILGNTNKLYLSVLALLAPILALGGDKSDGVETLQEW